MDNIKSIFKPIDLTKGNITNVLIRFMIPIMLSMFFQQIYTITDTVIVGQNLNQAQIAGINDAAILTYFVLNFVSGLTSGFSVVIAERFSKKDTEGVRKSIFIQLILSVFFSVILTIGGILTIDPLLSWLGISASTLDAQKQMIYESAYTYLLIIYIGTICSMLYNLVGSILRALGDSFTPFLFLVVGVVLNIFFDLLFIVVFKWEIAGAAIATVLTQLLTVIGTFVYAYLHFKEFHLQKSDLKISMSDVFEHIKMGVPLGFQYSILSIGIIIMQKAIISFDFDPSGLAIAGAPCQLGYGVSNKVGGLMMTPLNALGSGMLAYMGQNHGVNDYNRIRKGFQVSLVIGTVTWILMTVIGLCLTINGTYQYMFLSAGDVTEESLKYGNIYLYISLPNQFFLMILFICRNALQGIHKPLFPFLAGIGELVARTLICIYLPTLIYGGPITSLAGEGSFSWPYAAVCLADPLAWFIAGVPLLLIPFLVDVYIKAPDKKLKIKE